MQIKDLAIGDGYVYLMEGGTKVKFYALCHNYEPGLNGKGRTMFCRESPPSSGRWGIYDSHGNTTESTWWNEEAYYSYLNDTYYNKFSSEIKNFIGSTKCYCFVRGRYGNSGRGAVSSLSAAILALSVTECYGGYADGTILSSEALSRIQNIVSSYGTYIWSRTITLHATASNSSNDYYQTGIAITESGTSDTYDTIAKRYGYLPCFTLPETLYIDSNGFPTKNAPPEVTSDAGATGAELGEKNAPFTVGYTVTDKDGDLMTVTEKLDGEAKQTRTEVATGTALTVDWLAEKAGYQQVLNGSHTLTLTVSDGKTSVDWAATFSKNVTGAKVSLTAPLTADDTITVAALTLEGSFPADMSLTVELTNNALDDSPVWETATDVQTGESRAFVHHVFANKSAAKGAAFNYKVTITRGESGTGGTLTMIGGVIG